MAQVKARTGGFSVLAAGGVVVAVLALPLRGVAAGQPTAPMREHHRALLGHLTHVWRFADTVGTGRFASERQQAQEIAAWLEANIKPHAESEERYLYPQVARLMGARYATKTMSLDHVFVGRYIAEIRRAVPRGGQRWRPEQLREMRAALYRLQGLLLPHFEKEEKVYLPILDHKMSAAAVRKQILEPMEKAQPASEHAHGNREHGH